jgi:deoxyadenosine/deoxycytidine kinase
MERARFIAIEGPVGVGKTALAERLARALGGRLLLEPVEDNPFLARFHAEPRRTALQTQLFFLLSRWQQQQALWQQDLFSQVAVTDFLLAKDRIYAAMTLEPDEHVLYERVLDLVGARAVKPDLVVYLQARADVLMTRIRRRGRPFERDLAPEFLDALCKAYGDFFFHYEETPLLVVNANDADLAGDEDEFAALLSVIRRHRRGTHHYVPMATRPA